LWSKLLLKNDYRIGFLSQELVFWSCDDSVISSVGEGLPLSFSIFILSFAALRYFFYGELNPSRLFC